VSDQFDSEPPESRKFSAFFNYVWFVHVLGFARESPERTILDDVNSQTGLLGLRCRDYSTLSVDTVDDCTFWYTNHVAGVGGTGTRPTRIASLRFGDCK
jgi:hypothetical protein